jgi:phenylpropionate dioxygenase-like ring-hydroxylating dioxygenase large terminal subunit
MKTEMTNHRWVKENPDLGTGPVPIEPCVSPSYYELEREQIFKKCWLIVGRTDEVPKPGDFFVHDMPVADTSIVVVRGRDGKIRAFHNMCSHRGNKLVWEDRGTCKGYFTCLFHSWAYDTTGALRIVTDEENFFDLDKSKLGLTPVACDVWKGFIFINVDPAPRESLTEYLAGLAIQLDGFPFEELRLTHGYSVEEQVNWKVLLDAQNEVYHLPYLHEGTFPDTFAWNEKKAVRNLAFKRFGRHCVYANELNADMKITPAEALLLRLDPHVFDLAPTMIGGFDFYVLFPNTVLAFLGNGFFHYRLWPKAVDRTVWEIRMYNRPPRNAGEALVHEYTKTKLRDTLQEDACTHEKTQSILKSGAKTHFMMQDEEVQIRFFHKMVEDHVRGTFAPAETIRG